MTIPMSNQNKKIRRFYLFLFVISGYFIFSQNEANNWYFGNQAALSFSSNPPTLLLSSAMNAGEGCASVSDGGGNLLFYSNGVNVWNNNHSIMANGSGLLGNVSSSQAVLIVKQPGSLSNYYVFTQDQLGGANGLNYSVVDMTLAAGLGSVTVKNAPLYTPSCEKLAAARHCNGKDAWILTHDFNSSQFRVFLLSSAGLSPNPVITSIGSTITNTLATAGYLKVSPNGRKIACANSGTVQIGNFELFDFDNMTGVLSHSLALTNIDFPYGCEFSPDGSKFYGGNYSNSAITQWNLCASSNSAILSSSYAISTGTITPFAMQIANDGKIYISYGSKQYLGLINNPNNLGSAMNFTLNGLSIAPKVGVLGLPNFINNYNKPIHAAFSSTIVCSSASFVVPAQPTLAATCSITPYPTTGYLWDFGELSSGSANASSLSNPSHVYQSVGSYSVNLIIYSPCAIDTLKQIVTISNSTPTFAIAGPSLICTGEKAILTATGAANYSWSVLPGTSNTASVQVSPTVTTLYTVSSTNTLTGCKFVQQFTMQVNKCMGIESNLSSAESITVFPSPAEEILYIKFESKNKKGMLYEIEIISQLGQVVLFKKVNEASTEISVNSWEKGLYLIKIKSDERTAYKKLLIDK